MKASWITRHTRPQTRLMIGMVAALWLLGTIVRLVFVAWFTPAGEPLGRAFGQAMILGARFDLRVAVVTMATLWILATLPYTGRWLTPRRNHPSRHVWRVYWWIACAVWAIAIIADFGFFSYLSQRLSALVFSLVRDVSVAAGMVWESYHVVWIAAGLGLWLLLAHRLFDLLWRICRIDDQPPAPAQKRRFAARLLSPGLPEIAVFLLAVLAVHGKWSQYPLRWSEAAELPTPYLQNVTFNPLQNIADTWEFATTTVTDARMSEHGNDIRAFVGLPPQPPGERFTLLRTVPPRPERLARPMNVVLVLLESFSAHKTGVLGNPLDATPHFDALARDGVLFTRMMTAHAHTARGVFATLTGIPDVTDPGTASRNPRAVSQHLIANEFHGYDKYYFIGGSTSWANIRGFLTANLDGLHIIEEGQHRAPVVDVWGISDKNLFFEADAVFRAEKRPFFAVIQTAGNHRPYTIPDEDQGPLGLRTVDEATLAAQGFISNTEYNAFRYLDWCIGQFMERARGSNYFDNTLFVFIGDHGISAHPGPHLPPAWGVHAITQGHTPLLLYAPKRLKPGRVDFWAQQVDVMPTIASLVGIGYHNTTLGRDLFDPRFNDRRYAFTFHFLGPKAVGLLVDHYYVLHPEGENGKTQLFDITSADPLRDLMGQPGAPHAAAAWSRFLDSYHLAATWLQTNNPRLTPAPSVAAIAPRGGG